MAERVLVTAGRGEVGSRVADRRRRREIETRIGVRSPQSKDEVRFKWDVPATFGPALHGVDALHMTAPTDGRISRQPCAHSSPLRSGR